MSTANAQFEVSAHSATKYATMDPLTQSTSAYNPGAAFSAETDDHGEFARIPTGDSVIDMSSIIDESGRTYQGFREGKYFFPNDPAEQDRLDFQHVGFTILLEGKLALAPMEKTPEYVLDIATGTGIWAVEYAEQNPESTVIGTDLAAIQPASAPPNCSFIQDDCEEPWVFPEVPEFDYIHFRHVFTCFKDAKQVIKQAYDNLRPGGWVELQDVEPNVLSPNGSLEGTAMVRFRDLLIQGIEASGRDLSVTRYYKDWLVQIGFVEVVEKKLIWPSNAWPKDARLRLAGRYQSRTLSDGAHGIAWRAFRAQGLSPEAIEELIVDYQTELADKRHRAYTQAVIVYGRKPFVGEEIIPTPPRCEVEVATVDT